MTSARLKRSCRRLALAAACLLSGSTLSLTATFDLYIDSYCPPSPAFCGAPGVTSEVQYKRYIKDAVQEINVQWEVNGISFRPYVNNIVHNVQYEQADCSPQGTSGADNFNHWRANVAGARSSKLSILLNNFGSAGMCCSEIPFPGNTPSPPEAIYGIRCKAQATPYNLGSVLAHEMGHHFCLCHTHGWANGTKDFMDTATWSATLDGPGNPLDWDGENNTACGIFDTDQDPGRTELWPLDQNGQPLQGSFPGVDKSAIGLTGYGHEGCDQNIHFVPGLVDDDSPHGMLCSLSCWQRPTGPGDPHPFLVGATGTTARNAMSYYDDWCRGPYVVNGLRYESFTPQQKDRIGICRQEFRSPGTANPLVDVCFAAGGDLDYDGICQAHDNCDQARNTAQVDTDHDGMGDVCDPEPTIPDNDGDGCADSVDQHPADEYIVVGSQLNAPCGFGVEPVFGHEGADADGDGLLNCEDPDDDNDGLCDEGGPLADGTPGTPSGGCIPDYAGTDACPLQAGDLCHLQGIPFPCPPEYVTCQGKGCFDFILKLVPISDPDPLSGIVFERFQVVNRMLYISPLPGRTLTESARVLQGDISAAPPNPVSPCVAAVTPGRLQGPLRLEMWACGASQPAALVAEYDPAQVILGDLTRGDLLVLTPPNPITPQELQLGATWSAGLPPGDPPLRDTDRDGLPDPHDNCIGRANPLQSDADGDRFGDACDADLDNDLEVSMADAQRVNDCDGAAMRLTTALAEPASIQGIEFGAPPLAAQEQSGICRSADLDADGFVGAVDAQIARDDIGLMPGPSAFRSLINMCYGVVCNDSNPCTQDACDPPTGQCLHPPTACDDGDACTRDLCDTADGSCSYEPFRCDDGDPCTLDSCNPADGSCSAAAMPDGTGCNDGNACTLNESCQAGVCAPASNVTCDDGDPCTPSTCDPATGSCQHGAPTCDDGNPCTVDQCGGRTGCAHTPLPDNTACNDANACTLNETCQMGACTTLMGVNCNDMNLCTIDQCDPSNGACQHETLRCDDANPATTDGCEPASGMCTFTPMPLAPAQNLTFANRVQIVWDESPAAFHWNTYRGTIPAGLMSSPGRRDPYDHLCFESADAGSDGALRTRDFGTPPSGTAWYYLVAPENSLIEGPPGSSSGGGAIPILAPCPSPP